MHLANSNEIIYVTACNFFFTTCIFMEEFENQSMSWSVNQWSMATEYPSCLEPYYYSES